MLYMQMGYRATSTSANRGLQDRIDPNFIIKSINVLGNTVITDEFAIISGLSDDRNGLITGMQMGDHDLDSGAEQPSTEEAG